MTDYYLVLNVGSSSVKFAGFAAEDLHLLFQGQIASQGRDSQAQFEVQWQQQSNQADEAVNKRVDQSGETLSLAPIFDWLGEATAELNLQAVGHRVVHGGERFQQPVLVDDSVMQGIEACESFAPLHNPANLKGIRSCLEHHPEIPQVAVFDTAFHQSLPPHAYLYALPYRYYENLGVRRYGFHGTSHEYIAMQAAECLQLSLDENGFISLHLGNGCSAAAIENGKSLDTSMGLTPLEGMMMGTRSGDIDPGLPQYLHQQGEGNLDQITQILNKQSGLLGVSQISSDMREVQGAAEEGNEQARLALDMFCYRAAKAVASMRIALSRCDALIFTGGIGEHSARVRAQILNHLTWMGFQLDQAANENHGRDQQGVITSGEPTAMVVPTDEEWMIARHVQQCLASND